jgi:RNA 3'-phosphate cyclase
MIKIDGSLLEGGGAILRNSVALSALYQKPIEIFNIRANRSKPGLRNQHAKVIEAIAKLSNAKIKGVFVGSEQIQFIPGELQGGVLEINVGTAGSLSLLLQAIIPVAAHCSESVKLLLTGGTDVRWSPPIDFIRYVYLPMMEKIGLESILCIGRRGHYPKGGGKISCDIEPLIHAKPIQYSLKDDFETKCICGRSHTVRLPCSINDRMINSAAEVIKENGYELGVIERECPEEKYDVHLGPGAGITLWSCNNQGTILAGDGLGEKGLPAEKVGEKAALNLIEQLKISRPIDYHLADQMIIWMGISNFPSIIDITKITLHTLTNIEIIKKLSGAKFTISGKEGKPGVIECEPNIV